MAYRALYRQYRPNRFSEVVGQDPITTTLKNQVAADRPAHAYLFCGTRGTGKTTSARILARAVNCLSPEDGEPCGKCEACLASAGEGVADITEIDAASNNSVSDVRDLIDSAQYAPLKLRRRVFIIDEVHMLSGAAFNALLKTLEEPPAHVKFILATTELRKVPATIQSRCQCFNFRNISPEAIGQRLTEIVAAEGATADDVVIRRVARLANGSMRDALSILDQLLSVSTEKLDAAVLDEILPPTQDERVFALLQHAAAGDVAKLLTELDQVLSAGRGLEEFCNDAIEIARTLMVLRACGADAGLVDIPAGAVDNYLALSREFELSHYIQMIAALEELRRNVRYSGAGRALTEALMIRFARLREWTAIEQVIAQLPEGLAVADEKKKSPPLAHPATHAAEPAAPSPAPTPTSAAPPSVAPQAACESSADDEQPPEYDPGLSEEDGEEAAEWEPPAAPAAAAPEPAEPPRTHEVRRQDASDAEREQMERDPLVRKTLELFDGIVIRVTRQEAASTPESVE